MSTIAEIDIRVAEVQLEATVQALVFAAASNLFERVSLSGLMLQKPTSRSGYWATCSLVQSFSALTFWYSFPTAGRLGLPY